MFYSQFILAKKGPLGTIWIAAHLERKLRKNQVADTDIGVSVDSILSPDVPIALRLSSHLLLGVVRIYNKKVNYLFDDCSEALLKIKQAFRSTAVDLPPEESKAPYHSITLPETFDLDDFELPDSDIFQGYVDHHISSKEQITLQDTMEGVSYSTSKFGLDERFGDGDASGLDLDEELFLDKVGTEGHVDESAAPHASFGQMFPLEQDEQPENTTACSGTRVDDVDEAVDQMDYAQAPCTPGLVEQPSVSNVPDSSACEDHLESKDLLMASAVRKDTNDVPSEDKQESKWCSQDDMVSNTVHQGPPTQDVLGEFETAESKPKEELPVGTHLSCENKFINGSNVPCQEDSSTKAVKEYNTSPLSGDETHDNHQDPKEIVLEKSTLDISGLDSTGKQTPGGLSVKELLPLGTEIPDSLGGNNNQEKVYYDNSALGLDNQVGSVLKTPGIQADEETHSALNLDAHDKEATSEALGPCNSAPEIPAVKKPGCSMPSEVESDTPIATDEGEDASKLGEASCVTGNLGQNLKENQVEEHASGEDMQVSAPEANDQVHTISQNNLVDALVDSTQSELPVPEKLLSEQESHMDLHRDMVAGLSPRNFEEIADGDAGTKSAGGRKRSFTESTLTEQSLNSVESSRQVRAKRTVESVPDDDDLLSSILVGRRSSTLKVKPTPLLEVTSMKRTHTASRPGAPKRKVPMDDAMVLHGDTIRKQLTNTEDIRRVRKKAPCTLPEISMIQQQHLEDEIFLNPFFSGMSTELVSLHSQMYDLTRIRVCQNNAIDASLEIMTQLGVPSKDDKNSVYLETMAELNLTSCNEKHIAPIETVAEQHLTSPNVEISETESDKRPDKTNIIEESEQWVNNGHFILMDNERVEPSENMLEEVDHAYVEVNINQVQGNATKVVRPDGLQLDLSVNVTGEGMTQNNDDSGNPDLNTELEPLDFTQCANGDMGDESVVPDPKPLVHSVELDCAGVDDEQSLARTEAMEKDGDAELGGRDDILPDKAAPLDVVHDAHYGELECNIQRENCDISYEEQRRMEFSDPAVQSVPEDGSLDNDEKTDNPEDIHPKMADAEISGFDMHNHDEFNYFVAGNDTEFLNVDDDELAEIADEYIPDAEEKQYTENSGWSSRTRAVSKYLQAAFIKEADSGRTSLSMNKLLTSKSCKEASRMFFETLVLKTRDYIHAEQTCPFGDITIKPRTRLMKSDF